MSSSTFRFLGRHRGSVALAVASVALAAWYGSALVAGERIEGGADAGVVEAAAVAAAAGAPVVEVATVQPVELRDWNSYSGRLTAVASAEIKPLVGGTIMAVLFEDGQLVRTGDPLFVIDPRPHQNALAQAEAALATAKSRLQLARDEFRRSERLHKTDLVSDSVFETARSDLQVAEAAVLQTRSVLEQARLNLEYAHITAPIDGRVSRAELTVGNVVDAGANAPVLTTIVADTELYAEFDVDEQSYVRFARGQRQARMPVLLSLAQDDGVVYEGSVHSFDNRLDSSSGTIRARAIISNTDGVLTPGLYVNVQVGSAEVKPTMLVPERAIGTNQTRKFVYVDDQSDLAQYREVSLGASYEGRRIVREGLQPGDRVVVNGLSHIAPNAPVNPVPLAGEELLVSR